jgi:hypothetical protein
MSAHVEKRPHSAVASSHHQDRQARGVVREIIAGVGQARYVPHNQRQAAEEDLDFAAQPIAVEIAFHGAGALMVDHVGRVTLDEVKHSSDQINLSLMIHRCSAR